jgi:hypothetical protein
MAISNGRPITTKAKRKQKADKHIVRRGVSDMNPYNLIVDEAESSVAAPLSANKPSLNIKETSKKVMIWLKCEYFYSWADKPYFIKNDFREILINLGFN